MSLAGGFSRGTRSSLLIRLRDTEDHEAWREFESQYRGLLIGFCCRRGLQHFDAEDIVQRVMAKLVQSLPQFVYDPARGRFRDYLYRTVRSAISDWVREPQHRDRRLDTSLAESLAAEAESGPETGPDAQVWEDEWMAHHYRLAVQTLRSTVEPRSVEILDRSLAGASVTQIAGEFQMSEDAVRKARLRTRTRIEELIAEQIREEDAVNAATAP